MRDTRRPAHRQYQRNGDILPNQCCSWCFRILHRTVDARALTRLYKHGLVEFVSGTIGTYSHGPVLMPEGEKVARLLAYPTVQRVEESASC